VFEVEKLLRHLMNCGFVIYECEFEVQKFAIGKIITPLDNRKVTEFPDNIFNIRYDSFADAIKKAQELTNWLPELMWNVQIMYQHRGRGSLVVDLAPVVSSVYELAIKDAQQKGEQYISETFPEGDIEKFEVRIRPCGRLQEAKTAH